MLERESTDSAELNLPESYWLLVTNYPLWEYSHTWIARIIQYTIYTRDAIGSGRSPRMWLEDIFYGNADKTGRRQSFSRGFKIPHYRCLRNVRVPRDIAGHWRPNIGWELVSWPSLMSIWASNWRSPVIEVAKSIVSNTGRQRFLDISPAEIRPELDLMSNGMLT